MRFSSPTRAAMLGAAAVTAQYVAGKATRDALFLTSLDFTALPAMLVATSLCSIVVLAAHSRVARVIPPTALMPATLVVSGMLFVVEWLLWARAPQATAIAVYLHVSAATSLVVSGFWLIVSERFDPRSAKRHIGYIAGAGTVGGLLGALCADRVAVAVGGPAMLVYLAGFQFVAAFLVRSIPPPRRHADENAQREAFPTSPADSRSAIRVVAEAPHLRQLVLLVLLGTTSAAMLDYLFKARAVEAFGPGDHLLRFFAIYYAATSLVTFVLQTTLSRVMLERFGLGLASSTPAIAALAGSVTSLAVPGLGSLLVARGGEAVFRSSWFRAGYELFFVPIPAHEKRVAKSVIDVGVDRLGDAVGGGLIRLAVVLVPTAQYSTILALAMLASAAAILAATRLNHWYVQTLATSLVANAGHMETTRAADDELRQLLVGINRNVRTHLRLVDTDTTTKLAQRAKRQEVTAAAPARDEELDDAVALRTRNHMRAIQVLSREHGLSPGLVHDAIGLLAVDSLAEHAMFALCKIAEEHVGQLGDALLDPRQDSCIRLRLAQVFAFCSSQRAADVLMVALTDSRFDVRFQSGRSLAAIRDRNPRIRIARDRIHEVVIEDVSVVRPVWESHEESLAHVFTLLSLVMPRDPLRIAYRSLRSDDRQLRGTALEYLEGVLPAPIKQRLWPLLVPPRAPLQAFPRDGVLRSRPSNTWQAGTYTAPGYGRSSLHSSSSS